MNEITEIHNSIMEILFELQSYHNSLEKSAFSYSQTSNVGLSITNFIHTLQYENMLVREQIHLYVNYLSFFHNSHKTYLNKLIYKIKTFQQEMEEDITNTNIQPFSQSNSIEQVDLECVFAITENMNITTILEDSDKVVKDSEDIIEKIENIIIAQDIDTTIAIIDELLHRKKSPLRQRQKSNPTPRWNPKKSKKTYKNFTIGYAFIL